MGQAANLNQFYEILGLKPGTSQAEVKQAYRDLAKIWHPDRCAHSPQLEQAAEAKIKEINAAYQHLKDCDPSHSTIAVVTVSTRRTNPETCYNSAVDLVEKEKYRAALEQLNAAIRINPDYGAAYQLRASVHLKLGFELKAEDDLQRAGYFEQRDRAQSKPAANTTKSPSSQPSPASASPQQTTPTDPIPWQCIQTFTESKHGITTLALSRDGKILVSAGGDATIHLWNLRTGKPFHTFMGHTAPVLALALSADGQLLASAGEDSTIRLWHVRSRSLIRTLIGHTHFVKSIALSPDQQMLVSGSCDGTVRLWQLGSGDLIRTLHGHPSPVTAVAIAPDGQTMLSSRADQVIEIYQLRFRELLRTVIGHSTGISSLIFSSDGQQFASSGKDGSVMLWDAKVMSQPTKVLNGHIQPVTAIAFSPDTQCLATASEDGTIKVWSVATGELLSHLAGHTSAVTAVAYAPTQPILISSSLDCTIRIWQRKI